MTIVQIAAPAKINLALHVTSQRSDGYHEIDTCVAFATIGDELSLKASSVNSLLVNGPFASGLADEKNNLVAVAEAALRSAAVIAGHSGLTPVNMVLCKNLPIASGIGGGSADAAATLLGLKALWQLPASFDLLPIAASLGADVPMCLLSLPVRARGTGEKLEACTLGKDMPAVLVNAGIRAPTERVFGALKRRQNPALEATNQILHAWLKRQRNDLQEPAIGLFAAIAETLSLLRDCDGIILARMSGSGATCFGLFATMSEARAAARLIGNAKPSWWCVATQLLAGPNPSRLKLEN